MQVVPTSCGLSPRYDAHETKDTGKGSVSPWPSYLMLCMVKVAQLIYGIGFSTM
jgi:hypothetical protein